MRTARYLYVSKPDVLNIHPNSEKVERDRWIPFLAVFTQENRGAHGRLDIAGSDDIPYIVELEDRPFFGVAADVKDGEDAVWLTFGATPDDRVTHGVQQVTGIWAAPATADAGAALEIRAQDKTRTLLQLTRPEDFAIPPVGRWDK